MRVAPTFVLSLGALVCVTGPSGLRAAQPGEEVAYRMVAHAVTSVEMPRIRLPDRPAIEQKVNE